VTYIQLTINCIKCCVYTYRFVNKILYVKLV